MKLLALLLATATLALSAQDASLGIQAHGTLPTSDLKTLSNGEIGLGVAAFVAIPLENGLVLRPLVGFQHFPNSTTLSLTDTKTAASSVDFMMEGLWFPGGDPERGPYLLGAMGGQQWHINASSTVPVALSVTRLGLSGGLGYESGFNLGIEMKVFWSPVSSTLTATGLSLGATVKF